MRPAMTTETLAPFNPLVRPIAALDDRPEAATPNEVPTSVAALAQDGQVATKDS